MEQEQQGELPLESFLESLRDDVKALGGSTAVGKWFQAEKSDEAQRNYVNDRLNGARRERFSEAQIELIMRRAVARRGYSAALYYLCDIVGAERPKAKDPEAARERAMARFVDAVDRLEAATSEAKRLGLAVPLRRVG